jgi:hypothetical protein
VNEEHGRPRAPAVAGGALPHHRQRDAAAGDDDLLTKRADLIPIHPLFNDTSVKDHLG